MPLRSLQPRVPPGGLGFALARPTGRNPGPAPLLGLPPAPSRWDAGTAPPVYRPQYEPPGGTGVQRKLMTAPPVYRPRYEPPGGTGVQRKLMTAPPVYRPRYEPPGGTGVQRKLMTAPQGFVATRPGVAQAAKAKPPVIQCLWCEYCRRDIQYSYDHDLRCPQRHHRTYETAGDRDANYYDRPRGGTRTRSGSYDRQYSSGAVEHRHYHENLHGAGYVERATGYTDSGGVYHQYR